MPPEQPTPEEPAGWQQPQYAQPPYSAHQAPYGGPAFHPALQGAAPVPAGLQIGSKLLEALIISIPASILGLLAFVPFFVAIFRAASDPALDNSPADGTGAVIGAFIVTAFVVALIWLLVALFFIWWLAARGKSIGNAIFGLRLVSTTNGQPIGWGKALLWYVVVIGGSALTGGILGLLFLLSPLFDNVSGWNQAWQDKMVGAVLISHNMGRDTFSP